MNQDDLKKLVQEFQRGNRKGEAQKLPDDSEKIIISSLALLKMLNHRRAGVPLEFMVLMLGSFVGEYNIAFVDIFVMP